MKTVRVRDKSFSQFIPAEKIKAEVCNVAERINADFKDRNPLFICVLNGAFRFAGDLLSRIDIDCEITFVRLQSYNGTSSSGKVKTISGLNKDISGRHVIIVEDIVDTGLTARNLYEQLERHNPESIHISTLLFKPGAYRENIPIDYIALEVPNAFLIGYGLDYCESGRNLNDLYTVCDNNT